MSVVHKCVVCREDPPARTPRPTPYPGPRCASHHRAKVEADKQRRRDKRAVDVYGLLPGEYDRLLEFQGGRCAICQIATGKRRALSVDHWHESGEPRALVCSRDNRETLGRNTAASLRRAADILDSEVPTPYQLFLQSEGREWSGGGTSIRGVQRRSDG